MTKLRKVIPALFFVVILFFSFSAAFATEGGGGAYHNGVDGFMAGAIPPPGTYFLDYIQYYHARKLKNKDGNDAIPNFDLKATANVFRFLHVTKQQIFGGNWGMQLIVPLVNIDVSLSPAAGVNLSDSKSGLGDITIDPIMISWHSPNFHWVFGLDITVPTGAYDQNDLANIGRNYYTFEPVLAFTYLTNNGFDLSAKFMYDINTKNSKANLRPGDDYLSGQEFHFDYTVAKKIDSFSLGLGGYYYKQMTSDEVNGVKVDGSQPGTYGKGQVFAIGPQVKYDYKNMFFVLKYQKEMEVKSKPEGDNFWFSFMYAF